VALRLCALDVEDQWRWRWLLLDESGTPVADHQVALDRHSPEVEAFEDAYQYLRWNADQTDRLGSEADLVRWIGEFVGEQALGTSVGRAIVEAGPVTVRVEVPSASDWLAFRPWELAHVDGMPLAARPGVVLLYDLHGAGTGQKRPVIDALRMLALFSLPTESSARALRRERHELARLVRRVSARSGRRIELSVAQYGVTRERLSELADNGDGWDVLHLSGHGSAGEFLLETESGTADPVTTEQLTELLQPSRLRLKLVVISACQSAAATTAETLHWLGLEEQARPLEEQAYAETLHATAAQSGLARAVVNRLGCAAVAMRYPVADDFAVSFADEFYSRIFERRQTVDRAFAESVAAAAGPAPTVSRPALSIGTPAVFGASSHGLALVPPRGRPSLDPVRVRMAGFPPEPERFVGQSAVMAAASRALAARSGRAGVLFVGMAGVGKTTCALELAYRHEDSFAASAFWSAPTDPEQFGDALRLLAISWEKQFAEFGFTMVEQITSSASLEAFLPRLKTLLRNEGLLLVLDNLETLLSSTGGWRDPRWGAVMDALTTHGGESRVIFTSRINLTSVKPKLVDIQPVHALSRGESVLLARELPHLGALLQKPTPTSGHSDSGLHPTELAMRAITMAQGYPKLLELADATAADPALLARAVDQNSAITTLAEPSAMPSTDSTNLDVSQFHVALAAWTASAVTNLPEGSLLLLRMLCRLEDTDRHPSIVKANWGNLWRRLQLASDPPELIDASAPLELAGLAQGESDEKSERVGRGPYLIHPGLAQAVRDSTPEEVGVAIDTEIAAYWTSAVTYSSDEANVGQGPSGLALRAGIAAVPYLLRLREWDRAAELLSMVLQMDHSASTAQAVIPPLRRIAENSATPMATTLLEYALSKWDPEEAEGLLRGSYDRAVAAKDHRLASALAGRLAGLLRDRGQLAEALHMCDEKLSHTRAAGLGPWSQLADKAQLAWVLGMTGRHAEVLRLVRSLRTEMEQLPDDLVAEETVEPWKVREAIFEVGRRSAEAVGEWELALDLNAKSIESETWRGEPAEALAFTRFTEYQLLMQLGRLADAERSLLDCEKVFEGAGNIDALAFVLRARADLAARREDFTEAERLARLGLRLCYLRPDPDAAASCHYDLATYLVETLHSEGDRRAQRAHRLAGALLQELLGQNDDLRRSLRALAAELQDEPGSEVDLPSTLESIATLCSETDGVQLANLISSLTPAPNTAQETVERILARARDLQPRDVAISDYLTQWEPVIAALVDAASAGHTPPELGELLDELGGSSDWTALVGALRRVLAGERSLDRLKAGLDEIDTVILTSTLDRLSAPH